MFVYNRKYIYMSDIIYNSLLHLISLCYSCSYIYPCLIWYILYGTNLPSRHQHNHGQKTWPFHRLPSENTRPHPNLLKSIYMKRKNGFDLGFLFYFLCKVFVFRYFIDISSEIQFKIKCCFLFPESYKYSHIFSLSVFRIINATILLSYIQNVCSNYLNTFGNHPVFLIPRNRMASVWDRGRCNHTSDCSKTSYSSPGYSPGYGECPRAETRLNKQS